jgi:hypothetical protein
VILKNTLRNIYHSRNKFFNVEYESTLTYDLLKKNIRVIQNYHFFNLNQENFDYLKYNQVKLKNFKII